MMRIGLINCDPLTPQVRSQYGDYSTMFADLFALVTSDIVWSVFDATLEQLPSNAHECDAYLITGSHFGVQDQESWIQTLTDFVQTLWEEQIKTIGICFGHQLMAYALGAQVERAPTGWGLGVVETTIIIPQKWMHPRQHTFHVYVSHQDQVLTLPSKGLCLANTSQCPYAVIQYGKTFLSFQGHPEFNQNYAKFLIDKRKALFTPSTYTNFINSLGQNVDTKLLANWMLHFINIPRPW